MLGLLLLLLACWGSVGCGSRSAAPQDPALMPKTRVSVVAAANLRFAFEELETAFERQHPELDLVITYGASAQFFAQLSQLAPFDIFFSADTRYPQRLVEQDLAIDGRSFPYAQGRIVVWVPHGSPLDLEHLGLDALLDGSVNKIAIANPRLAPYGEAAEAALQSQGLYEQAQSRLILADDVMQAAQFLETEAADVGILPLSLALAPRMAERGRYWEIPVGAYPPIQQAGIIPVSCSHRQAAEALRAFVLGPAGQAILGQHGYSSPISFSTPED